MASMQDYNGMNPVIIQQMLAGLQRSRESSTGLEGVSPVGVYNQEQELQQMMDLFNSSNSLAQDRTHLMNNRNLEAEAANEKRKAAIELSKLGAFPRELSEEYGLPIMDQMTQAGAMRGLAEEKASQNLERAAKTRETVQDMGSTDLDGQSMDDMLSPDGPSRHTPIVGDVTQSPEFLKSVIDATAVTDAARIQQQTEREQMLQNTEGSSAVREEFSRGPDGKVGKDTKTKKSEQVNQTRDKITNTNEASRQVKNNVRVARSKQNDVLQRLFPDGYTIAQDPKTGALKAIDKKNPSRTATITGARY